MRWVRGGRVKVLISLAALVGVILFFLGGRLWWMIRGVKPDGLITVSRETTYLTEPLDEFGFVDYVEAIDREHASGVTPEDNFEVVMRFLFGLESVGPAHEHEYLDRLGIKKADLGETRFEPLTEAFDAQPALENESNENRDDRVMSGTKRPWTAEEYPAIADWLQRNNAALDLAVDGSNRLHDYTPYVSEDGTLLALMYMTEDRRELARGLVARAMFRIGTGDAEPAWNDIQAVQRISRHTAGGASAIEGLVGIALDGMACEAAAQLLQHGELDHEQLGSMADQLQHLDALPPFAEKLDRHERLSFLDSTTAMARTPFRKGNGMPKSIAPIGLYQAASINWNAILRQANVNYDELVAAARIENSVERRRRVSAVAERLMERYAGARTPSRMAWSWLTGEAASELIERVLFALLMPAVEQMLIAEDRAAVRLDLTRLAIALERHRTRYGNYPEALDRLVPDFIATLPVDRFSNEPFVYRRHDDGFTLYSVGLDGIDDGGAEHNARTAPKADDIALRITR